MKLSSAYLGAVTSPPLGVGTGAARIGIVVPGGRHRCRCHYHLYRVVRAGTLIDTSGSTMPAGSAFAAFAAPIRTTTIKIADLPSVLIVHPRVFPRAAPVNPRYVHWGNSPNSQSPRKGFSEFARRHSAVGNQD
jgi:hypothetical protein